MRDFSSSSPVWTLSLDKLLPNPPHHVISVSSIRYIKGSRVGREFFEEVHLVMINGWSVS